MAAPQLVFKVNRRDPELITPSKSTPQEFKSLSDIDDQHSLRGPIGNLFVYPFHPAMLEKDPVKVIRESLAKALVFYYPLAGRLREGPNRKLMVECNGKGVLFIEADADVALEQFGDLRPPFPDSSQDLLLDVPGSGDIVNCPLMLIQVTRLKCGAIILGVSHSHTICDATGLFQFLTALSEMARGDQTPSILPVWMRHILNARNPPRITCTHQEFEEVTVPEELLPPSEMTLRSFFFGPAEISAIRELVPVHLRHRSSFEILTACLWRCRAIALQPNPTDEMRLMILVNARRRFNPPIPQGYYGNCIVSPAIVATAGELCQNPIEYTLELVRKAKNLVTEEYVRSTADLLVIRGRKWCTWARSFIVSDVTTIFRELDFGWGKAVYGGPWHGFVSIFMASKNKKGEDGTLVTMWLPIPAMEGFVKELDSCLKQHPIKSIKSAL